MRIRIWFGLPINGRSSLRPRGRVPSGWSLRRRGLWGLSRRTIITGRTSGISGRSLVRTTRSIRVLEISRRSLIDASRWRHLIGGWCLIRTLVTGRRSLVTGSRRLITNWGWSLKARRGRSL